MDIPRPLLYVGAVVLIVILALIVVSIGPHTSPGVSLSDNTATVPAGKTLVLTTIDRKFYSSISRHGETILLTRPFYPDTVIPLCGPGCPVQFQAVLFYSVTVTPSDDGSMKVDWPFGVMSR